MRLFRKRRLVSVTPEEAQSARSVPVDSKSVFLSKTFWANLLAAIGGVLAGDYMVSGLALVNLVLRLVTKKPVTVTVQ